MARITCKTPSTGKVINYTKKGLGTEFFTLAAANDFSVPDTSRVFGYRDPADDGRAIRPGEIFFLTPLLVCNTSDQACYVEVKFNSDEGPEDVMCARVQVPARDTAMVPIQGRSLFKRRLDNYPINLTGDQLVVRAQIAGVLDLWASGEEKLSSEHIGVA